MKIEINDRCRTPPGTDKQAVRNLTRHLLERLRRIEPGIAWREISILLTDDAGSSALNRDYFGDGAPTDVISFRYEPAPGDRGLYTAEIVLNVQRAVDVASRRGGARWTPSRELALYLAHGCDHLSGEDDADPRSRRRMRRRELRWLREADAMGLIENLLPRHPKAGAEEHPRNP